ncbi:helix-turn-helix domain-containing protein [Streptomyces sp. NPDC093089]|uniref:helix-turn-helix domain-containing protein n=1 Tax=Streptomyces sp. NPDC093089 TaxID=3366024 RepID=UPI00382BFEA4
MCEVFMVLRPPGPGPCDGNGHGRKLSSRAIPHHTPCRMRPRHNEMEYVRRPVPRGVVSPDRFGGRACGGMARIRVRSGEPVGWRITSTEHGLSDQYGNSASGLPPRSSSLAATSSPLPWGLPAPSERRRLREQRGLSTRQVAAAFGVTPATVRSWEGGRSTPRGGRKEADRRFLAGLAQHGAHSGAGVPVRSQAGFGVRHATPPVPRIRRPPQGRVRLRSPRRLPVRPAPGYCE